VISHENLADYIENLLEEIQENLYQKALKHREENTHKVDSYEEFKKLLDDKGGFILAHWDGTPETEERIKEETKATIRCIPLDREEESGVCMVTGKPSKGRVLFARAY
jgi:prolyl-tRNA synthetase